MANKIIECRICKNKKLERIIELGEQSLTGIFPKTPNSEISSGPLNLVKCTDYEGCCGLVQLEHSYNTEEMFGLNYGYKSSLNSSMIEHLKVKVNKILQDYKVQDNDLILDIGSNDGTTLSLYPKNKFQLVGIDPTGKKFAHLYEKHIDLISDFFSSSIIKKKYPNKKAKVITSFSMFYDLEEPMEFMRQIYDIIDEDGIWVFEQSYLPSMIEKNSFDTICHEHLEYYSLHQIKWMTDKIGFKIIDIEFNDINGGSFSITVQKGNTNDDVNPKIEKILLSEATNNFNNLLAYNEFKNRIHSLKIQLKNLLNNLKSENKKISALGASTKGNVLLQYCGLDNHLIDFIGEVNEDKYGCFSPGTNIPIISEEKLLKLRPDYLLILPWHFKNFFITNTKFQNINLIFPLPNLKIIKV